MTRRAKREGGLLFINVCEPAQLRDKKQRRLVRSHVSALQHELRRRHDLHIPAPAPGGGTALSELPDTSTGACRQAVPHHYPTAQYAWTRTGSEIDTESTTCAATDKQHEFQASTPDEPCLEQSSPQIIMPESMTSQQRHAIPNDIRATSHLQHRTPNAGISDQWHAELDILPPLTFATEPSPPLDKLDLTVRSLNLSAQACIDYQSIDGDAMLDDVVAHDSVPKDDLWKYIKSMLREPTFRAMFVLFGAASLQRQAFQPLDSPAFLKLVDHALKSLQQDVNDTKTSLAEGTILSVSALALYEGYFGTQERCQTHVRGLETMLGLCTTAISPFALPIIRLQYRLTNFKRNDKSVALA